VAELPLAFMDVPTVLSHVCTECTIRQIHGPIIIFAIALLSCTFCLHPLRHSFVPPFLDTFAEETNKNSIIFRWVGGLSYYLRTALRKQNKVDIRNTQVSWYRQRNNSISPHKTWNREYAEGAT